jgi:hypothetical protein
MNEMESAAGKPKTQIYASGYQAPTPVMNPGPNVLGAMHRVMQAVGYAQKQGENEFHGYKYVTEADAIAALRPAMVTEGLILIPSTDRIWMDEQGNTHVLIRYTLFHAGSGESVSFFVPGSGNDMAKNGKVGDKGVYKALTGASKYALLKTFLMETGEDPEVASVHDKEAVGTHTPEEEGHLKAALAFAQAMITDAAKAGNDAVLNDLWRQQHAGIEHLRSNYPEVFAKVRNAFTKRKEELAQSPKTEGEQHA